MGSDEEDEFVGKEILKDFHKSKHSFEGGLGPRCRVPESELQPLALHIAQIALLTLYNALW